MQTTYNISSDIAVKAEKLSKIYRYRGLISSIFSGKYSHEVHALNDFSFNVKKGEVLGLIGSNGSGKSTLMKVLSGVTQPSSGTAEIDGKLLAAIEVSGGFNPDLTGYNNLVLTAKIWGYTKEYIHKIIPEIIDFSELKDFIHLPVKKYSSGMISRLASSLIIHSDADIFLLDEVLNGSDLSFRRKMHKRIIEENQKGKTIIIASHTINDILALCTRTIIIHQGKKVFDGNPFQALHLYRETGGNSKQESINEFKGHYTNTFIEINDFIVNTEEEWIKFKMSLSLKVPIKEKISLVLILNNNIDSPIAHAIFEIPDKFETTQITCTIPRRIMGSGHHFVTIAAFSEPDHWMFIPRICGFSSQNDTEKIVFIPGMLLSDAQWEMNG